MEEYYDYRFNEIQDLKWLPWVGEKYRNQLDGQRILLVGESHYDWVEDIINQTLDSNDFTRRFIFDHAIGRKKTNSKIIQNIERAILGGFVSPQRINNLWHSVSYHNIIQRPLENINERPNQEKDFKIGWEIVINIIEVLRPNYVIFLGVESIGSNSNFINALSIRKYTSTGIKNLDKIGSTIPRKTQIRLGDFNSELLFIKHPSSFFSWKKWTLLVRSEIPIIEKLFIKF